MQKNQPWIKMAVWKQCIVPKYSEVGGSQQETNLRVSMIWNQEKKCVLLKAVQKSLVFFLAKNLQFLLQK